MNRFTLTELLQALAVALAYAMSGQLGFSWAISPGNVTAVWPPSGVALASALICGRAGIVGVGVGSLALNFWFYSQVSPSWTVNLAAASAIAVGSTLQAWVAAYLVRKLINAPELVSNPRDASVFVLLTILCCAIASTIGVTSSCLTNFLPWQEFGFAWVTWWAGDAAGVLVFAPLIMTWRRIPDYLKSPKRALEFAVFFALLCTLSHLTAGQSSFAKHHYPIMFWAFPLLIWAAGRFGISAVTLAIPVIEIFVILGLKYGYGPFVQSQQNKALLVMGIYMLTLCLTGLTYACVINQWQALRKKLEGAAQELEGKVTERTLELERVNHNLAVARDRAIESSNIKSAFVANISHELRTPLSGILGMNELLLAQEHSPETRQMLEMMHDSGQALLGVVNDILDLSKIEAGKMTLEHDPFNPVFVVQDCAKLLAPAAARKSLGFNVTLDQHMPEFVFGDQARVRQILINLIGNAVKFTEQGNITVRLDVERQDDRSALMRFAVIDTGIGIDKADEELLFTAFSQVDTSSTRKFGGTGLGLTICKRYVELMGGEIGFESEKGQGSTFWFAVPFDKTSRSTVPDQPARKTGLPVGTISSTLTCDRKVLVVEDNDVLRELAVRQLAAIGVDSMAVSSGKEGVELATTGKFSLILMDVNLPDLSGYQATIAIRESEKATGRSAVVIIAMTARAMRGDRDAALNAGMNDYLAKPVNVNQLKLVLEKWLATVCKDSKDPR